MHLPKNAFLGCALEEIEIPASVEQLPDDLFAGEWAYLDMVDWIKGKVKVVTFAPGCNIRVLGSVFRGCKHLKEIIIPASVEEIGEKKNVSVLSLGKVVRAKYLAKSAESPKTLSNISYQNYQ